MACDRNATQIPDNECIGNFQEEFGKMWCFITVHAYVVSGLDADWLQIWFKAYKGKWQMQRVYAFSNERGFLGDVPRWSLPWNLIAEFETKAILAAGKPAQ